MQVNDGMRNHILVVVEVEESANKANWEEKKR